MVSCSSDDDACRGQLEQLATERHLEQHVQVRVVLEGGKELSDERMVDVAHDRTLLQDMLLLVVLGGAGLPFFHL